MLSWLPPIPDDFRERLRQALALPEPSGQLEALGALAAYDLGLLETIQVDRALSKVTAKSSTTFPQLRVAILASATVDQLVAAIRVAALRRGLVLSVYVGGYGQYRQELLDETSALYRFAPELVLLSLTARDVIGGVPLGATPEEADAAVGGAVEDLRTLWTNVRERLHAAVVQQTILDLSNPVFGGLDRQIPGAPARLIERVNAALADHASTDGVLLLDVARQASIDGQGVWHDRGCWLHAKQEIAPLAAPRLGELLARLIGAQRGLSKKCLVLDLDNTLWHGVIGDDGLEGIVLGEGSALGEAHLAVQRYAKQLSDRGIILAICSKNDLATAEEAFRSHPEMHLKRADIASFIANWSDKAENLKQIAENLNIGLDSLVFVDDNPVERTRIRQALPMVAVPELPDDPALYTSCVASAGYFEAIAFTVDDRQRASQYAANTQREMLRGVAENMDEFLQGLGMTVEYGPVTSSDLARVTQLINKTNQFNPTTRRHQVEDVTRFAAAEDHVAIQFRLVDRFGDNGLVSVAILTPDANAPSALNIDCWVMSCRVFGRELEYEAMNLLVEAAAARGIQSIRADYIPTSKNGAVKDLYPRLGFLAAPDALATPGASRWVLRISEYAPRRTHILRRETAA